MSGSDKSGVMENPRREWCEKHQAWYVPFTGPTDPNGVPCLGCATEAEAWWRQAEDHNIRTILELPE